MTKAERIEELNANLSCKQNELAIKQRALSRFKDDLDPEDFCDQYDQMLDDCNPEVCIGSLTYSPSQVLHDVDPIAYRCGLIEYVDSFDEEDMDGYSEIEEEIEELEDEITDIEKEIVEAEEYEEYEEYEEQ